jgi:putative phosphoribosyl transferase
MYRFHDRREAGKRLASALQKYANVPGVILAVPRGGVPVAYEVARELNLPLEVILVKKIGHPFNPEYAIGAVGMNETYIVPHEEVNEHYIQNETGIVRARLAEMKQKFFGGREPVSLTGRTVIIVDDGIATGNTMLATVRILRRSKPAKIIIAVPVISTTAMQKLSREADELIAILVPENFSGVGAYYRDFSQLTDEEVFHYLDRLRELRKVV